MLDMLKLVKKAPELHSLEESLAVLNKYRKDISKETYGLACDIIKDNAIEHLCLNEADITAILICGSLKSDTERENFIKDQIETIKQGIPTVKAF